MAVVAFPKREVAAPAVAPAIRSAADAARLALLPGGGLNPFFFDGLTPRMSETLAWRAGDAVQPTFTTALAHMGTAAAERLLGHRLTRAAFLAQADATFLHMVPTPAELAAAEAQVAGLDATAKGRVIFRFVEQFVLGFLTNYPVGGPTCEHGAAS